MAPQMFIGSFTSLPGIRCDRFDNLKAKNGSAAGDQFFLSHCHTDHMQGFDALAIFLKNKSQGTRINNKLYCSEISKSFVLAKYPKIPSKMIVDLVPNEPKTVHVYDSNEIYKLRVTALPSNHCPGSIMFLFERLDSDMIPLKRILYTGDFRFDDPDVSLTSLTALHDKDNNPIDIDEMYLDTTFCSPEYLTFPTRHEAKETIWELCQKWIKRNGMFKTTRSKHVILFQMPSRYGYESILQHVYEKSRLNWLVHVDRAHWREYLCSEELSGCTDCDPKRAEWIHACSHGSQIKPLLKSLPCQQGDFEVCQIRPSAIYFTQAKMAGLMDKVVSVSQGGSNYRVCFSCHSSLTELTTFVQHFKPLQITPCSVPPGSTKEELREILAQIQLNCRPSFPDEPDAQKEFLDMEESQNLEQMSPHRVLSLDASQTGDSQYDPDNWASPSPPKRKKRSLDDSIEEIPAKSIKLNTIREGLKISFDDTMELEGKADHNSSDEEDAGMETKIEVGVNVGGGSPVLPPKPSLKRKNFALSKLNFCSMPVPHDDTWGSENSRIRRSSMPPNMKMPIIKVTPSSPSPDPNHPDYPEFFEDKLYLDHIKAVQASQDNEHNDAQDVLQNDDKVVRSAIFSKPRPSTEFRLVWEEDDEEEEMVKPHEPKKDGNNDYLDDSIHSCFESLGKQRDEQEFLDSQAMCDNDEMDSQAMCDSLENPEDDFVDTNISDEADTPEIETQIKIAKKRNLSPSVMQTLQKHAKICDNVVIIDIDQDEN